MKKILVVVFVLIMAFSLTACGGGSGDGGSAKKDFDSFSIEAVEYYFDELFGMEISDLEPEWEYTIGEYGAYADSPSLSTGHAAIYFTKAEGELSDEEYEVWLKKVFDATAAISQDGHNIIGWEFVGEGEAATDEVKLEDASSGWGFRYDDTFMIVYTSMDYDTDKESATPGRLYYDGVEVDIGVGLQKSFDETWDDMEQYMEENEDEIKDAVDDYLN